MDIPILFFAYVLFWGPIYVCRFYVSLSVHAHALESVRGSSLVAKAADGLADVFVSAGPLVAARKKTCCCCCRQKPGLLRSCRLGMWDVPKREPFRAVPCCERTTGKGTGDAARAETISLPETGNAGASVFLDP